MNNLEPGNGGVVSARPSDDIANPPAQPNQMSIAQPIAGSPSKMMQHFNSREDTAAEQFKTIKESKAQIDSVMTEFKKLTDLQDTVTTKDVVKGCAGIVAAGVPAVQMASILADMPESGQQLQAWVKHEYEQAVTGDQKISEAMNYLRHQLMTASLHTLIAHSAEAKMMSGPVQGNA